MLSQSSAILFYRSEFLDLRKILIFDKGISFTWYVRLFRLFVRFAKCHINKRKWSLGRCKELTINDKAKYTRIQKLRGLCKHPQLRLGRIASMSYNKILSLQVSREKWITKLALQFRNSNSNVAPYVVLLLFVCFAHRFSQN